MASYDSILVTTSKGLYCPQGDFFIDPNQPVERAVVTHAHSDHAHPGSRRYLAASASEHLMRLRMQDGAEIDFLRYRQSVRIRGVSIEFHPAGHILGSAQVRLEYRGQVVVVTGDYKLDTDLTCAPWEPVPCDLLVTESTFGLPIYNWPATKTVYDAINQWWRQGKDEGKCCILYGYAVGKAQSLLAGLDTEIGPIYTHGAVEKGTEAYRKSGVALPETQYVGAVEGKPNWRGAMVVAVPSAHGTRWMRRFGPVSTAMASGWMMVRGARRRRSMDRGFVLSDHVDWKSLLNAVEACDPETVWVTHGYTNVVARYLNEQGRNAIAIDSGGRAESEKSTSLANGEDDSA